ncbi:MAG: Gfo/Idh/MocA family oxidoreductase [Fuerstiella sp.]|nr:Gfo/Idh/MocA family oxidoreductase [Fuerstiella sp.]
MQLFDRRAFVATAGSLTAGLSGVRANRSADRIKIGQIGTGHAHASGVFSQLKQTDDFQIVGVVENDPMRRRALGESYHDIKLVSEDQLLNTRGLQAVVIETEVEHLLPTAKRCAEAGLHIHLDKPPGETLEGFQTLVEMMQRQELHLQLGYIYRYHTAFQFCYRIIKEGWLGDIFELHGVMSKKVSASSRTYLSRFTGGSMFEIGCHLIDAMVRVLGHPLKTTAFSRQTHPEQDSLVDNQLAVFDYPNAIASVRSALVEYSGQQRRQFTVCGEFGTFDLRPLGGHSFRLALERPRDGYKTGYQEVTVPGGPGVFVSAFRDMASIIRQEKETDYPLSHELAVHEATLRAAGYSIADQR